ncbi:MAG: hypothetical protein AAF745_04230 [Planctomycetota bacterium]
MNLQSASPTNRQRWLTELVSQRAGRANDGGVNGDTKGGRPISRESKRLTKRRTTIPDQDGVLERLRRKSASRLFMARKRWTQWRSRNDVSEVRKVFIFGCQRSGTSMLCDVLRRDLRTEVLDESSRLTWNGENRLRLRGHEEVRRAMDASWSRCVIAKPLVESQHAKRWLDALPDLRVIWMHRRYEDVIQSHLRRFDSQLTNLESIVKDADANWRNEGLTNATRELVARFYHPTMSLEDAAALHWYVRNSLFFENDLHGHERVDAWCYEAFVKDPAAHLNRLYNMIDMSPPNQDDALSIVDGRSVGHGARIDLSKGVRDLCEELSDRFRAIHG